MKKTEYTNIIGYAEIEKATFEEKAFNQVDSLTLSQFCYIDVPEITTTFDMHGKELSFAQLYELKSHEKWTINREKKQNLNLFENLAKSPRFKDMKICCQYRYDDLNEEIQFCATTFLYSNFAYIAFRGTDSSIFGWKEDFNMSFMNTVPSHLLAGEYLLKIATKYPNKTLILGGHSKGGNLACFAAMFNLSLYNRIRQIFSHDGPGFRKEILESANYIYIKDKIHKTLPESSVIGKFLLMQEKFSIVKSDKSGMKQHNIFNWRIKDGDLIYSKDFSPSSLLTEKSISQWVDQTSDETRRVVVDSIFGVVKSTGVEYLYDMPKDLYKNVMLMVKSFRALSEETKDIIVDCMKKLIECTKTNILMNEKISKLLNLFEKRRDPLPITTTAKTDTNIQPLQPEDYKEPNCSVCDGESFYNFNPNEPQGYIPIDNIIRRIDKCEQSADYVEARRVIDYWIKEAEFLKDYKGELTLVNELLGLSRKQNDITAGFFAIEKVKELVKLLNIENDISSATIYINVATTLKCFSKPEDSIEFFERAKTIYEKNLKEDDIMFAALYNNYATTLVDLKQFEKAEALYNLSLTLLENKGDKELLEIAVTHTNLADLYYFICKEQGCDLAFDEKIDKHLDQAYKILTNSSLNHNSYFAFVSNKCADCFSFHGRFLESEHLKNMAKEYYDRT